MERHMIFHIFNSSLISGPETLAMPALAEIKDKAQIIWLREARVSDEKQKHVASYMQSYGLTYHTIPVESRLDKQAVQKLKELFEKTENLEVAHAHDVKASFYLLKASEQIQNRKFQTISTHHGVFARSGFINHMYEKYYAHFILPKLDRTLTVCSSDRLVLIKRGLKPAQVVAHLNGVTRNRISQTDRLAAQKKIRQDWGLNVSEDTFVFGVAARLDHEKRHNLILDVAHELKSNHPNFKFVILCFGRGPLEESLKKRTKLLGLDNNVQWRGYRSHLGQEFAGFDSLLSLSSAEGLPINLIESGWAATPVFASNVNGVGDLVTAESLGTLVAADEDVKSIAAKIVGFAASKEKLAQVGLNFQAHVEKHFSQAEWLKNLLEIYRMGKG
ncbi:hypothetical protein CIK05_05170 [Bdellovibrio sp. qaytius]|nr:hypothetical protein CIK05_05170 [Bdellovibrio sp. qaytius]